MKSLYISSLPYNKSIKTLSCNIFIKEFSKTNAFFWKTCYNIIAKKYGRKNESR